MPEPGVMSHETAEILREAAWGGDKAARRLPDDLGGPRWPWRVAEDLHTPQVIREAQRRPLAWD